MAITAAMVKELREITGAGMMDCKNALEEAGGDMEKAVDVLKEKFRGMRVAIKVDTGLLRSGCPPEQPDEIGRLGAYRLLKLLGRVPRSYYGLQTAWKNKADGI